MKVIFFDVGYTLVNEDAVWERRCREQAVTEDAKKLGLSAQDIYHEIEIATISRKPQFRTVTDKYNMKEVVPLFVLATVGLFFMDKIHLLTTLERWFSPIVVKFLGLPVETTSTFIMGFLRRDYGASGIYTLAQDGLLTGSQILVSSVVITLFVPCLAQSLMVIKEHGIKTASIIFVAITTYAVLFGGILNFIFKIL